MIDYTFSPPIEFVLADLNHLESSITSFREPMEESVRQVLMPSIDTNFHVGGRPAWEPLHGRTRTRNNREGRPLVRTGNLRQVATSFNIWAFSDDEAWIDRLPGAEYGVVHQTGAGGIPERPWAVYQTEDEEGVLEVFEHWIDRILDRTGWD